VSKTLFAFVSGCVAGLCVGIVIHDWSMAAHAGETFACRDEPDRAAWMARKPGEAHSVETCIKVPRYGDPAWIPYFTHPLKGHQ
jgi:hypothetical protein